MTGRVIAEYRASYDVLFNEAVYTASLRGHFHEAPGYAFPKVGDYVTLAEAAPGKMVIENVLPRHNTITRLAPHDGTLQVMVANVDYLCIVMGLDADFNIARLERYLALADQSNVAPVIILNKADHAENRAVLEEAVVAIAPHVPVHMVSALTGEGMDALQPYVASGKTLVLLGSSGAGKSTITNYLMRTRTQATTGLRERDGRGRHTTTHRQLFILPTGGHLIDTPGMRELALIAPEEGMGETFADVERIMNQCRFSNCDHDKSDGCAVQAALLQGTLTPERWKQYQKIAHNEERVRRVRYGR